MSSSTTQCPSCFTRFRVTAEQLSAHNGMVKCGRCSAIFNASEQLQNETRPKLFVPAVEDGINDKSPLPDISDLPNTDKIILPLGDDDEVETLFQQIELSDDLVELTAKETIKPPPSRPQWPWVIGSLLLVLFITAQAGYFFRVEIASQLPGLKPSLTGICGLLKCTLPLPAKADLMSIESSDLEADPLQPNIVKLSALLHNRAEYSQAFPNLELSLTDNQNKVLARRIFTASEYLPNGENEKNGAGANRELNILLHLDTGDLKPTGYKLLLFYP